MPKLPTKEHELLSFAFNFRQRIVENPESFGLTVEDAAEIDEAFTGASNAYSSNIIKHRAALAERAFKDDKFKKLRKVLRRQTGLAKLTPGAPIFSVGLRPRDKTPTAVKAPSEPPRAAIDKGLSLRHEIRFWERGSKRKRRKPKGVIGAEIYIQLDGERGDRSAFKLHGLAASTPFTITFKDEDRGRQAHYYLRWVTRRGDKSAVSDIFSATITG